MVVAAEGDVSPAGALTGSEAVHQPSNKVLKTWKKYMNLQMTNQIAPYNSRFISAPRRLISKIMNLTDQSNCSD